MTQILLAPPLVTVYTRVLEGVSLNPLTGYQRLIPSNDQSNSANSTGLSINTTPSIIGQYGNVVNSMLNYGILNGVTGGSSTYILELDIWNNEPALSGGVQPLAVSDVVNLAVYVQDSFTSGSVINVAPQVVPNMPGQPVVYARCVTNDFNMPWTSFLNGPQAFTALYGNVNPTLQGMLAGNAPGGDHAVVQTRITLQPNTPQANYSFALGINYDYYPQYGS